MGWWISFGEPRASVDVERAVVRKDKTAMAAVAKTFTKLFHDDQNAPAKTLNELATPISSTIDALKAQRLSLETTLKERTKTLAAAATSERASFGQGATTTAFNQRYNELSQAYELSGSAREQKLKSSLPVEANDYDYYLVPGLLGEQLADAGYFKANQEALQAAGLNARIAGTGSQSSIEDNIPVIRAEIQASIDRGRKVVCICHSRGGNDVAATLSRYPELIPFVRLITLGTPYRGSPMATAVAESKLFGPVASVVSRLLGGGSQAATELSEEWRQKFITENPHPQTVPTISVTTRLPTGAKTLHPLFVPSVAYVRLRDERAGTVTDTDGIVPTSSARLPGALVVELDHLGHDGTVLESRSPYQPGPLTLTLVDMIVRWDSLRPAPSDP